MIEESLLKEILTNQKSLFLEKEGLFKRAIISDFYQKYKKVNEIIAITGIRRSGKSSLLKLIWDDFKKKDKLSNDQFLYFNFEDERLADFDKSDFSKILEAYYFLNQPDQSKKILIFLDEIQNVKYWEKWLNRLREENRFKIFITGSNSALLSSEFATALTGRNISITLYPLSFYEYYVYFKNKNLNKQSLYNFSEKIIIKKSLQDYLKLGGMPEYLKTQSIELIQEYFKNILFRDIVNRYNIKYKQGLKELAHILLANLGQICSLRSLSKAIEIKNINTIKNYLQYLENSFLFFHIPMFSFSYKKQIYNPDKIYVVDPAFFFNIAFKTSQNIDAVYENAVFIELLRHKDNEVFYYKTKKGFEVDFVVKQKNKVKNLIQVSYDLSSQKTLEREQRALIEAMSELNTSEGIIINKNIEKEEIVSKSHKILFIPLYKWLLEK